MNYDFDSIITKTKNGEYKNIAKSGTSKCYDVSDEYVLVEHSIADSSKRFKELSDKLGDDYKCIYTVVDYKEDNGIVYELQRKAKGEHFRIDHTKKEIYDNIEETKRYIEDLEHRIDNGEYTMSKDQIYKILMPHILKLESKIETPEFQKYIDTRKEELLRRYDKILKMPKKHIIDFYESILILQDNKLEYDSSGNNILYDEERGFSIIDLTDCSNRKDLKGDINTMLDYNNYQTNQILLGTNNYFELSDYDMEEIKPIIKKVIIKICSSLIDFSHNGEQMTVDIMNKSLETYKKIGLDISYDDVLKENKGLGGV